LTGIVARIVNNLVNLQERTAALRVLCLNPAAARFGLITDNEQNFLVRAEPKDYSNVDTRLEVCRRPSPNAGERRERILAMPGLERVPKHDGRVSLRMRGVEFAELPDGEMRFGLHERRPAREHHARGDRATGGGTGEARSAEGDREHPLYRRFPEAWLESQAPTEIETIDATLR